MWDLALLDGWTQKGTPVIHPHSGLLLDVKTRRFFSSSSRFRILGISTAGSLKVGHEDLSPTQPCSVSSHIPERLPGCEGLGSWLSCSHLCVLSNLSIHLSLVAFFLFRSILFQNSCYSK